MSSDMSRVSKVSQWMEWVAVAGLIGIGVLYGALVVLPTFLTSIAAGLTPGASEALSIGQRVLTLASAFLALAPVAYILWQLRCLFRRFAAGEVFTPHVAALLRKVGWGCIAVALAAVLARTLAILTVSWTNPAGERTLAISVDGGSYAAVLFGALLIILGWVQGEAARIAAENKEII